MKQSTLFGKTSKNAPKDAATISHILLSKGGYIDQLVSGVYSLLPLGYRTYKKIEDIIREEMDAIGGQEIFMPTLQPKSLWQETGRWESIDPPFDISV